MYVMEFKACMLDIISILLRVDPSSTKLPTDSKTVRKTTFYRDRGKGMAGYMLAFNAVTEEHKKGTLHFHLVGYGGISPDLLQRAVGTESLCDAIAEVLDSQYQAKPETQSIQELAFCKSLQEIRYSVIVEKKRESVLLEYFRQREDHLHSELGLQQETEEQAKRQEYHDPHGPTCMEGFNGHEGCRLNKPSNLSARTRPVQVMADNDTDENGYKTIENIRAMH